MIWYDACVLIQAEIKALSDQSKLTHVYNSLRTEVARTREDLSKSEVSNVLVKIARCFMWSVAYRREQQMRKPRKKYCNMRLVLKETTTINLKYVQQYFSIQNVLFIIL